MFYRLIQTLLSIALVAALEVLRLGLESSLDIAVPFSLFFIAVIIGSRYSGFTVGLIATAASIAAYFATDSRETHDLGFTSALIRASIYAIDGILISYVCSSLHKSESADLTDEAVKSARKTEDRFRGLFNSVPQIIFVADNDGSVNQYNERWFEYTGQSRDSEGFGDFANVIHPDDSEGIFKTWEQARSSGTPWSHEYRLKRRDGQYRWHIGRAMPETDEDGKVLRFIGTVVDIQDEKEAYEERLNAEQRLKTITNATPDFIAYADSEMRYQFANAAYEKWLGKKSGEAIGKTAREVLGTDYVQVAAAMERVLKGEEVQFIFELNYKGTTRYIDSRYLPDFDKNGKVRGFVVVGHDVTEITQSREAVHSYSKYLEFILDRIQAAVMLVEPSTGEVKLANKAARSMTGGLQIHIDGNTDKHVLLDANGVAVPKSEYPRFRAARGEKIYAEEIRWETPDGAWDYLMFADQIPAMNGQESRALLSFLDITQLKSIERNLLNRERELETLANSIPQLAWIAEPDGTITWYNERWYEYTGTTAKEMEGWGWKSVHDPKVLPAVLETYLSSIKNGTPASMEFPLKGKNGSYRWFLTRWTPVKDTSGRVIRWFGTNTDITEIRDAQTSLERAVRERTKELTEAYHFAESVLENIPNMIFVKDANDLKFIRFNRAGEDLLGLKRETLIGKNDYDFFPPAEAQHFQDKDRNVLSGKAIIDIPEERISTARGEQRVLHTKKIPIFDEAGAPKYLLGISEDVTDRIKAESERLQLLESDRIAARLSFLAQASSKLTASLNLENILVSLTNLCVPELSDWCSVQLLQADGSLKQLAVAHTDPEKVKWAWELNDKYPPDPNAPTGAPQVLRSGKSEMMAEIPEDLLRAAAVDDEHWKMIESIGFKSYICSPIRVRERVIGVLTLVSTNESDRTFTNTELTLVEDLCARAGTSVDNARLFREAQNLNQVKDEFLATLSHELRTPINVIQGNADIIVSEFADTLPPDVLNSLTAIQRNSKLQTQIVSDLLDVSSIITGKVTYVPQNVSPAEIVIAVCNAILPTAQAKRVAISYDTSAAPLRLMADPTRLHQILWNLLNNATKFTSSGGTVFVKASQEGELCVFKVQDTGMGIDPEFLPHVFDRFRQADSSMSRRFGGLGLGLSIVKSLSETHGGKVEVESAGLGKGTAFTVSLPIRTSYSYSLPTANYDLDATAAPVNKDISLDGVTVLLVEDSPDNRELVVRYLRKKGVTVLEAESASSAREILQRQRPDLILSDIGMPGENGIEFIKRFRSEWKGPFVPAIALTAYVRPEEIADALKAGFQAHVSKPVTPNSLISEIANTLKATPSKPLHA